VNLEGTLPGRKRLIPTGICWCGCGDDAAIGSFFRVGHDKIAEAAVINTEFGGVAEFMDHYGFGPGGKNPREELRRWREAGGKVR
jgi:hypothetical protein